MRTTDSFAWRRTFFSLALCSMVGFACSSAGNHTGAGGEGGDEDTGGKSGDTGGKSGSTGGKSGSTGGKSGSTGGKSGVDAGPEGGSGGDTGGSMGNTGGSMGDTGGSMGSTGGSMGNTGGSMGSTGGTSGTATPPAGTKKIMQHVITFYSFQDNTPVNSLFTASGQTLKQFSSVAVPRRELKINGGTFSYGDKLWLQFLAGRTMPNGTKHTGWVQIDDFCGDGNDDSYCYQQIDGKGPMYPNVDLYIGDFSKSGFKPTPPDAEHPNGDCTGPSGSGQDLTETYWTGVAKTPATIETNYGGALLGTGKCGDRQTARDQQYGPPKGAPFGDENANPPKEGTLTACWGYDGQGPDTSDCAMCEAGKTCAP